MEPQRFVAMKNWERSQSHRLLHLRATSAFAQCRARRRIPIAKRQGRACDSTQSGTETLVLLNRERTLNFDAGRAEPQPRLLAAQAAGLAAACFWNPDDRARVDVGGPPREKTAPPWRWTCLRTLLDSKLHPAGVVGIFLCFFLVTTAEVLGI